MNRSLVGGVVAAQKYLFADKYLISGTSWDKP